ncbi:MAG TPA: hypothetical protein VFO65_02765 [Acidimicrobiales bacterium]|nr:hypothetical protein [Acidimicrobiales bacterium]
MTNIPEEQTTRQDDNPGDEGSGGKDDLNADIPTNPQESEQMDQGRS